MAPFRCEYCARYGPPGACEGCGAPNRPATLRWFTGEPGKTIVFDGGEAHYMGKGAGWVPVYRPLRPTLIIPQAVIDRQ